ncbi:MAG: glycosyltransferase family 1 protein, partial [Opitutus sp.]
MLLFDATHTSHTAAQTGIQRVCRALFAELDARREVAPVCYDTYLTGWRPLGPAEQALLSGRTGGAGQSRGAKWSLAQKIRGASQRWLGQKPALPAASGLICPEIFS